jgi:hypothetical protein
VPLKLKLSFYHSTDAETVSGLALRYGLVDRGFEPRQWLGIFLFTTVSRTAQEPTHPPIQWAQGLFLWVKRPERVDDHSPPSSDEVKNAWSYTFTPQFAFMAWCSVREQGQRQIYLLCNPHFEIIFLLFFSPTKVEKGSYSTFQKTLQSFEVLDLAMFKTRAATSTPPIRLYGVVLS